MIISLDNHESCLGHRLIQITDRTLHVVFSRFINISITITLRQSPKELREVGVEHALDLCL